MRLKEIQSALRERQFDAWLFYDHHYRDPIGYRVLGLPSSLHVTRRWYYLVPAEGEPVKLVHRVEPRHLDSLPGAKHEYSSWQEQHKKLKTILAPYKTVAMQYSPDNQIFTISLVDGGTLDLVRSFGTTIVSSANLISRFEATWTEEQVASHYAARDIIDGIMAGAFKEIGARVRNGGTNEYTIQKWILEKFDRGGLVTDNPPIVSVNANCSNPHYSASKENSSAMRKGDFILLDMWAKTKAPNAVFYDITWTGVVGDSATDRQKEIFSHVKNGRDAGFNKVKSAFEGGQKIQGWEVDKAARDSIANAGYGEYFVHRTGHSIGVDIHANGANMDNLETKDEREILSNSCFSVEPGIYLPEFGIRSEVNVLIHGGKAQITGRIQQELVLI